MRDCHLRFFRVPSEAREADAERGRRLAANGLPDRPRHSSVLGFGRAELPSCGVRDNFELSGYVPTEEQATMRALADSLRASTAPAATASVDPFAVRLEARKPRRLAPGEREPDRIFGDGAQTALHAAMPDDEKAMIRLDREIARAVGPRPVDRPRSLLANAAKLEYARERRRLESEIAAVRALH